jgi:hypothetical protein
MNRLYYRKIHAEPLMADSRSKAVAAYRRRAKRRGFVRVEVRVRREDAPLLRGVAAALDDPERAAGARAVLRRLVSGPSLGLKALLAAAPLEGIDLTRERDVGRRVDL